MHRRAFLFGAAAIPAAAALPFIPPPKAAGGIVRGGPYPVGERGPEAILPAGRPVSIMRTGPETFMIQVAGGVGLPAASYLFEGRLTEQTPHSMTFRFDAGPAREPAV